MDINFDWDNLGNNSINQLKYACQQLRVYPRGGSKKDYIYALHAYRNQNPQPMMQPKPAPINVFISPSAENAFVESQKYQNEFAPNPNWNQPTMPPRHQKIHSNRRGNIYEPPRSSRKYSNYSSDESVYSDSQGYSNHYESSASESERMSPLLPPKSIKAKSSKISRNKASTKKKVFSFIISIILIILILLVISIL